MMGEKWPKFDVTLESEPKFLFILTPPYSGSTALAKILNTSPYSMILQSRAEGQWLIPGMCANDRWNPEKYIDWESVRSTWLSKYKMINVHVGTITLVIDKSPPNLVRAELLEEHFRRCVFLAFNRDPYANCSSIFYRNHIPGKLSRVERTKVFQRLAAEWIYRSTYVKRAIDVLDAPHFTYERFCEDPAACIGLLTPRCPELNQVDIHAPIKVKDYDVQSLENQNPRQIGKLDTQDISGISAILAQDERILNFFGYQPLN